MSDLSETNFTPYAVRTYADDSPPPLSEEALERDRKMDERIEELRKKQLRREKLTYKEWEIIQHASQECHCGQRTVR
jgi:hypothetical protein